MKKLPLWYQIMKFDTRVPQHGSLQKLVHAVEVVTGAKYDQIKSRSREGNIRDIRHLFLYLAKKYNKHISLKEIGNLANRDHATVLHSVKRVKELMWSDSDFDTTVNQVEVEYLKSY